MSSRVTQCPKCLTSFRVTDAQLDIANGAVRCGSCLHIFNAPEHWIGQGTNSTQTTTAAETATEQAASPDDSFDDLDDDFLIGDEIDTDELFADDDEADSDIMLEDEAEEDELIFADTEQRSAIETDEDELFDFGSDTLGSDFSDSFRDIDSWEKSPTAVFKDLDSLGDNSEDDADDWAEKLLADDIEDLPAQKEEPAFDLHPDMLDDAVPLIKKPAAELDPDLIALLNEAPEKDYDMYSQSFTGQQDTLKDIDDLEELANKAGGSFTAGERIGTENKTKFTPKSQPLIANIEPEPVEITRASQKGHYGHWLWRIAAAIALLGLPTQYTMYNYDSLVRDNTYRPIFKTICPMLGCQLPALDDIGLIRSSNLMVRSHPKATNALVVDAMMTNLASFQQAFPLLELQFTDINGQIIAGRRFSPSDYLAGELTGSKMMPAKQPIHISLDIIDPGSAAVNYQLRFLPAQ